MSAYYWLKLGVKYASNQTLRSQNIKWSVQKRLVVNSSGNTYFLSLWSLGLSGQLLLLLQLCWHPRLKQWGGGGIHLEWIWENIHGKKIINVRIRWRMLLLDIPHIRSHGTWDCSYLSHHTYLCSFTPKICWKNHNNNVPTAQMPLFLIKWKFQNNEQESVISRNALPHSWIAMFVKGDLWPLSTLPHLFYT